jgi:hypothetical protein
VASPRLLYQGLRRIHRFSDDLLITRPVPQDMKLVKANVYKGQMKNRGLPLSPRVDNATRFERGPSTRQLKRSCLNVRS